MEKYYKFARHIFLIRPVYSYFFNFAKDYEVCMQEDPIIIENTKEEILKWQKDHNDEQFSLEYLEILVIHSKISDILAKDNVFIFHGSTVYVDDPDNAYIFTAPSGTGKSTHIRILRKVFGDRVNYINDDKPFIKEENNVYTVYGSPWDGKERQSNNIEGTLKGIFVISRSLENKVRKLSSSEAIMYLIKQIHLPLGMDNTKRGSDVLFNLVKNVPIYLLSVNMNDDAAEVSMNIMNKGE